jgi:hypothetical protein
MIEELKALKDFIFRPFSQRKESEQQGSLPGLDTKPDGHVGTTGVPQRANSLSSLNNWPSWCGSPGSPIERASSPVAIGPHFECDGWCRKNQYCPIWQPHVVRTLADRDFFVFTDWSQSKVSISACKDSQIAWEDSTGRSMSRVSRVTPST